MSKIQEFLDLGIPEETVVEEFWAEKGSAVNDLMAQGISEEEIKAVFEEDYGRTDILFGHKFPDITMAPEVIETTSTLEEEEPEPLEIGTPSMTGGLARDINAMPLPTHEETQNVLEHMKAEGEVLKQETEAKEQVSKAFAGAISLTQEDSVTAGLVGMATGYDPHGESRKLAIDYLLINGYIRQANTEKQTVTLMNGEEIPMESSFMDSLAATKMEIIDSIAYGVTTAKSASMVTKNPYVIAAAGISGSMVGASWGDFLDRKGQANFFGVELTDEQIISGMANAASDDALMGMVGNIIIKSGMKVGKLKNMGAALMNHNVKDAYSTYLELSTMTQPERTKMIQQASKLFGEDIADPATRQGKLQIMKYAALYDHSIASHTIAASRMTDKGISNVAQSIVSNTKKTKFFLQSPIKSPNAIKEIVKMNTEAGEVYSAMKQNFSKHFEYTQIDFNPIQSKIQGSLDALSGKMKGFDDKVQTKIENILVRSKEMKSIDDYFELTKQYNRLLSDLHKDIGSLSSKEFQTVKNTKQILRNELTSMVAKNNIIDDATKKGLLESFDNASRAYSETANLIETDLVSSLITKTNKNIKKREAIYNAILESAQTTPTKKVRGAVPLNDSLRVLDALSNEELKVVEKDLLNHVMNKTAIDVDAGVFNFGKAHTQLKEVRHLFKTDDAKEALRVLDDFDMLFKNDGAMGFVAEMITKEQMMGSGLSYNPIQQFKFGAGSKLWQNIQYYLPTILKEIPIVGKVALKTPLLEGMAKSAKQTSFRVNLADGLERATDVPSFFSHILNEGKGQLSSEVEGGIREILKSYARLNEEMSKVPERPEVFDEIPKPTGYGQMGKKGGKATKGKTPKDTGVPMSEGLQPKSAQEAQVEQMKQKAKLGIPKSKKATGIVAGGVAVGTTTGAEAMSQQALLFAPTVKKNESANNNDPIHIPQNKQGSVIGNSGITTEYGFDFGQQSIKSMEDMGISTATIQAAKDYIGKQKQDALTAFKSNPNALTADQLDEINTKLIEYHDNGLSKHDTYLNAPQEIKQELVQFRIHTWRLGTGVDKVLKTDYKGDNAKLANDLSKEILKLGGDKNRRNRTAAELKKLANKYKKKP